MPSHLWLVSAEGGAARRLTSGRWSLPKGAPFSPPASPLSWSSDGKSIAIVQQATPNLGDSEQSVVATLDVASGKIRKLTGHKAFEGYPLYSPDGSAIAYSYPRDGDPNNENELFVSDSRGGAGVDLTRVLDRDIARAIWMGDGETLLVAAHDGTGLGMWLQSRKGGARKLNLGDVVASWGGVWVDVTLGSDGALAFPGSTPTHPNEIYYLPAGGGTPRRLTTFNQEIGSRDLRPRGGVSMRERAERLSGGRCRCLSARLRAAAQVPTRACDPWRPCVFIDAVIQCDCPALSSARLASSFSPNYRGSDNGGNT